MDLRESKIETNTGSIRHIRSISLFIITVIIILYVYKNAKSNSIFSYPWETNHSTIEYHTDDKKIMILFTSLNYDKIREEVHNNTMKNWAKLRPRIQPVVFVDNSKITDDFKAYGWDVYGLDRVTIEGKTTPVLKQMFVELQQKYRSHFIGFANADILFTEELQKTMIFLKDSCNSLLRKKNVMVVGRRTNVKNISKLNATSFRSISSLAKSHGKLQKPDSMDLFITNHNYPWINLPELVIGRVKFDNWMIARARKNGHVTIDVTKTVLMLHQVVDKGSKKDLGNENKFRVNWDLLNLTYANINFHVGMATCTTYFTSKRVKAMALTKRTKMRKYCFDYYKNKIL